MSIQTLSLILLLGGVGLAFSQIRLSGWILGWILLSGALLLQGFRSMLSYIAQQGSVDASTYSLANDWMGLGFSLLIVAAMHMMREVFARQMLAAESLRMVSATANDAIIIMDHVGTVALWNDAAQRVFGYSKQEVRGKKLGELIVPERHRIEFDEQFHRLGGERWESVGSTPTELAAMRKGGAEFPTEYSLARVTIGGKWKAIYIFRDITARRQAEEAQRKFEREAQFRATFEISSVGMGVFDPASMRMVRVNRRCCEMTGYSEAELLGKTFMELAHPEDRNGNIEGMARLVRGEIPEYRAEKRCVRKDGSFIWCDVTMNVVRDREGKPELTLAVIQEISNYKRAQQDLSAAKDAAEAASRAKSTFLANMSHEIRTPLHNIIGLAQLLRRDTADLKRRRRLDDICSSSEHLLSVINGVLDFSKIEADRLVLDASNFFLGRMLDRVISVVAASAREKGLNLMLDMDSSLRTAVLRGDALRLGQVLINLVANAIKFSELGSVTLRVRCLNEDAAGVALEFAVIDTGIGITPAAKARLFVAFEQVDNSSNRKYGGSGLGLTISERLVRAMGGAIGVESELGAGSTFSFEIRLARGSHPDEDEEDSTELPKSVKFAGSQVLVAEDHPLSRELMQQMLSEFGCGVDLAKDGAEAVEYARAHGYDLILMDMQMPKLDGLAATRLIRALPGHQRTPILAITANVFAEDRAQCMQAGMNGHLSKPLTPASLAHVLGHWLAESSESDDDVGTKYGFSSKDPGSQERLDPGAMLGGAIGRELTREFILDEFLRLHRDNLAQVRGHLAAGDVESARKLAHTLEGASAMVGARRLRAAVAELGSALRAGADEATIDAWLSACEAEIPQLVAAEV